MYLSSLKLFLPKWLLVTVVIKYVHKFFDTVSSRMLRSIHLSLGTAWLGDSLLTEYGKFKKQ